MGEVSALKTKGEDPARKPNARGDEGLGVVLEVQVGNGSQLQFSTCLSQGDTLVEWNETLDKMRKAGERQKVIAEIASLKRHNAIQHREKRTAIERMKIAEDEYLRDTAARVIRIDEIRTQQRAAKESDEHSFASGARRGEYKPSTAFTSRFNALNAMIMREDEQQKKMDEERENAKKSHFAEQLSFDKTLEENEGQELPKMEALLAELSA